MEQESSLFVVEVVVQRNATEVQRPAFEGQGGLQLAEAAVGDGGELKVLLVHKAEVLVNV